MKMNSGPSQCAAALGKSRMNVQCCIGENFIRAAAADSNQEVLSQVNDGIVDTTTFPASEDPDIVSLGNDDQGGLVPFLSVDQYPNAFLTQGDGSEIISLLPSDGLLSDPGTVAFSLPEGIGSDGSLFGDLVGSGSTAFMPESDLGVFSSGGDQGAGDIAILPEDRQSPGNGKFEEFWA